MNDIKLKRCPFCGGAAKMLIKKGLYWENRIVCVCRLRKL